jgi:hypothetical protein
VDGGQARVAGPRTALSPPRTACRAGRPLLAPSW